MKRRKVFYWMLKVLSVLISCAMPAWAICEKFPLWTVNYGTSRSIGAGGILILVVVLVVFRRAVFGFLVERFKLKHAPPIVIWIVLLIVAYTLTYLARFMFDMLTVFWMGLIGSAIGMFLTFIAENRFGRKEKNDE